MINPWNSWKCLRWSQKQHEHNQCTGLPAKILNHGLDNSGSTEAAGKATPTYGPEQSNGITNSKGKIRTELLSHEVRRVCVYKKLMRGLEKHILTFQKLWHWSDLLTEKCLKHSIHHVIDHLVNTRCAVVSKDTTSSSGKNPGFHPPCLGATITLERLSLIYLPAGAITRQHCVVWGTEEHNRISHHWKRLMLV